MRIDVIFAGAFTALLALTTSALAKDAAGQKGDDKSTSSSCSAYQQGPDGTWTQLPCHETGTRGPSQTQHKPATQGSDQDTH
jgi:hypothetical protein